MPVTKQVVIDKIEILEDGVFQIRMDVRALDDDGSLIGHRYNRQLLVPGQDVTNQPLKIRRLTAIIWDAQTVADYLAKVAASQALFPPPVPTPPIVTP